MVRKGWRVPASFSGLEDLRWYGELLIGLAGRWERGAAACLY